VSCRRALYQRVVKRVNGSDCDVESLKENTMIVTSGAYRKT
jgi:hypothetical protein